MNRLPRLILPLGLLPAICALAQDGGGTIHASTTIHPDGTRSNTVTDPDKGTAEETVTDSSGKVLSRITYLLDERGQAIGSINFDARGAIQYRTSYKRDGENRVDEEDVSNATGQLLRRRVYTYGVGSKVTNIVEYDANGNIISDGRRSTTVKKAIPIKR